MKVGFLSNEHGPEVSGSAYTHRLLRLCEAVQARGIETDFVGLRDQPVGGPILAQPLNLPLLMRRLADCDVIHAGGDAAYTASLLKPFVRAIVVHDVHGDTVSEAQLKRRTRGGARSIYRVMQSRIATAIAYRHADYFLVVSEPMRRRLVDDYAIAGHRVALVRNGVDLDQFRQMAAARNDRFTICYAGGFQSWQGVEQLVSAGERLTAGDVCIKIIGFTKRTASLREEFGRRLQGRVELVSRLKRAKLIDHLSRADVLIIPRFEHPAIEVALPTKFGEYLALGKPVIVCDVDETAAMVRDHACGLVSTPRVEALAETLDRARALPREDLDEMGRRARELAERQFSWSDIGRRYVEFLNTIRIREPRAS